MCPRMTFPLERPRVQPGAFGVCGPQEQTRTEAWIDFLGLRPFFTLMNARARTVSVAPAGTDIGMRNVATNGALVSIRTRLAFT